MKKHYYLCGTILGLIAALAVAFWFMNDSLWKMLSTADKYNGVVPVLCGAITTLLVALWCDKRATSEQFIIRGILLPTFIFLSGVIIGSLFNMMNFSKDYSIGAQIFDWVFKPFYWLTLFGLPSAWILGSAYFIAFKRINKS